MEASVCLCAVVSVLIEIVHFVKNAQSAAVSMDD